MKPVWWVLGGVAAWEACTAMAGKIRRRQAFKAAYAAARMRGKPLLIVGEPDGEYPCGDVVIDIREGSVCPRYVKASVEDLSMFASGQFGACLCSHVLEHVCDPGRALSELQRVADEVHVVYPRAHRLVTWLLPGSVWIVGRDGNQLRFRRIRRRCNSPTRLGFKPS